MRLSKLKIMGKSFKRLVGLVTSILMILNMLLFTPINVFAETTNNDGDWNSKYYYGWSNTGNIESIVKNNIPNKSNTSTGLTTEADYVVRVGDIDDFGLGWVWSEDNFFGSEFKKIDPFSGKSTTGHYWGSGHDDDDNFKWNEINNDEPNGLDRIITVSSYGVVVPKKTDIGADGYSNRIIRENGRLKDTPKTTPKDEQGTININHNIKSIKNQNNNFEVKAAKLQMFVDDFQPKAGGSGAGGATYQVKFVDDKKKETRIPELEELINHLNQTGPVGKLITFEIPSKYYDLLESNNNLYINIDDPETGAGDGYAIDFVKLLINPKDLMHEGTIKGRITEANTDPQKPIEKAYVEVNGKWRIYTDEHGNYEIPNVTSGLASVKAYKAGSYIGKTKTIDVVDNQESILNFQLEPFSSLDNSIEVDKRISDNLGVDRQEEYEVTLEVKNKNIENNKILDNDSTENNSGSTSSSSNKISGYVWYDGKENGRGRGNRNGNGKKEPNEEGINGVTVKLYNYYDENNCIMTAKTKNGLYGNKGYYSFDRLESSEKYKVKVELPEGYKFTTPGNGNGGGVDERISKADPKTGVTGVIYPSTKLTNIGLIGGRYIENVEESITVSDFVIEDEVSDDFDIVPSSFKGTLNGRDISSKIEFTKEGNKLVWKFDDVGNKEDVLKVSYKIKRPNKDAKAGIYPTSTKPSTITYKLTDSNSTYENKKEFPQVEAELKNSLKAPLTLSKSIDKDKYAVNEEITINYKIQPEPIPAENIIPESYLKNKEIVLVMDTSGSMDEYIDYNNYQSIFEEKYAARNVNAALKGLSINQTEHFKINFDGPSVDNEKNFEYLTFYSDESIDEVESWLENLNYNALRNTMITIPRTAHWGNNNEKSFNLNFKDYADIDGNSFNSNKAYNVYVATIKDPKLLSAKVIGLSKTGNEINSKGRKKKIDVMKEVSKNFIEKFKENKKTKIALVPYESYAKDVDFNGYNFANLSNSNKYEAFVDRINNLTPDGGTNIGDGLRKAYYKFSSSDENTRKYVILMTDGEPTYHSYRNGEFYLVNTGDYYYGGGGDHATYNDRLYANKVAKDLILNGQHKIDSFMIAFSNDADKNELKNIANSANGYYKEAIDGSALDEVYQKLADQIQSDLPIHGMNFKETFPEGMSIEKVSQGLEINGQTVTGNIGSISYKLNKDRNQFEAEPFKFFIKLKGNKIGDYNLGEQGSYIEYKDIDGSDGHKIFPTINLSIYEVKSLPEVNIKVRDTSGEIEKDKQYNAKPEDSGERIDKILEQSRVLQGDAYADISVKGEDTDFFKYQFIKTSKKPEDMPQDGWIDIDLNKETINEDVIKEKQGYLNKRSYDVSHMKAMQNESDWNNPDLVFKSPFDATTYKPATYSETASEYGQWEEYTKKDKTPGKRWATNSVFMNEMDVAWSSGNTNLDYKEASKFWGYIKVPKDAEYSFGVKSDDGCKGYITVDGKTTAFVDMLKVQSSTFGTTGNKFNLKADKYYPIYLEYFNWGGRAQFEMLYSDSGLVQDSSQKVQANWFYPSNDNSPGEYTKTIFTGNKGVKFPTESGDYYIAFRTGKDGNITRQGIYGAFTVEGKTELTISKRIIEGDKVQEKNNFTLEYTIEPPLEIPAISTLKENENYKGEISLTNIQIVDEYPENIKNDLISAQKIIKSIPNIEYTKITQKGETVYKYLGDPIKVKVNLNAKKAGEYTLSEDSKSKITFIDFNGKANREQDFVPIDITVVERKQAEFDFDRKIDKDKVEVGETFEMTYKIKPTDIQIIDSTVGNLSDEDVINNITVTETLPEGIKIDKDKLPSGVTVTGNTITWNIGSITYELSEDKTKYVPSIKDKEFEITVTASGEEGTYNLKNVTITYQDVDGSTVTKNVTKDDAITVENEIKITTGMFINGEFQPNNEVDLVKGFDIDLGAKVENVKEYDIVLEIQDQDRINISKDKVKIYEGIDANSIDFSKPLSNINIRTKGKTIKIETSNIKEKKNYIVIYNVEALKGASIGPANVDIEVNSKEVVHEINIVELPNLE